MRNSMVVALALLLILAVPASSFGATLFAITEPDVVAEHLPYGSLAITETSSAYVSTLYAGMLHDQWTQVFKDGGTTLFTIDWQFSSTKTLKARFVDAVASGESVTWTVNSTAFGTQIYVGTWRFSNSAGDMAARFDGTSVHPDFSNDDGIWGGGTGTVDGNHGGVPVWGHGNYDASDTSDILWQNGVTSAPTAGMKNFVYIGTLTPVPEPSTLVLFGFGVLGTAIAVRRRRQRSREEE